MLLKGLISMEYKVLFVDDDANILSAYKRQLRKYFHIETARGSEIGLQEIKSNGGYAVIVSDLKMPGMDGNQFLAKVKDISPESIRIMLTGYADLQNAIEAINRVNIFRLLTKTGGSSVLSQTGISGVLCLTTRIGNRPAKWKASSN